MQPSLFSVTGVLSVGDLMRHLKRLLSVDEISQDVSVRGEISNFTRASSGHLYFSLKDREAAVRCVMWKNQALALPRSPRDGESVQAHGYVSMYETRGDLQLYVDSLAFDGIGDLWQQFEALKQLLDGEGLFDRKRPLPVQPSVIGMVTSESGAALQDMLRVLQQRWPLVQVVLAPCQVQGADAPRQIVRAIRHLNRLRDVEVIIVARGGGSIEDLWAFNDETVARAIFASRVPVVTGIGHETDFTIADFVADYRAPTPTAAAAVVIPDRAEFGRQLVDARLQLLRQVAERLSREKARLRDARRALRQSAPRDKLDLHRQRVDELQRAMSVAVLHFVSVQRERLRARAAHLDAVSPLAVLARGYAIVRRDNSIVAHLADVRAGDHLRVRVSDGEFGATVSKPP